MAITDKEQGVWGLEQVYNKQNEGDIWEYSVNQGLFMWGWAGDYGTLGQNGAYGGGTVRVSSPVQIPGTTWNALMVYNNFAHALKNDGSHWVWGSASTGCLGQNVPDNTHLSSPTQLPGTWSAITSANYSMMGIKTDGTMWSWGDNAQGHLGHNTSTNCSSPVQIGTDTNWGTGGNNLSSSEYSVQAIKGDGTLWVWGYNRENLGLGSGNPARISSPTQVGANTNWSKCRGMFNSMIATKTDGTMWSWGHGSEGQGGQNDTETYTYSPRQVGTDTTWTGNIWKGYKASFAVKGDGTLWAWGNNEYGMLGINVAHDSHRSSPVQLPGTNWRSGSSLGYRGVGATKTDGTFWAWGRNAGNLGLNSQTDYSSPVQVGTDTDWDFTNQNNIYGGTMGGLKKAL